MFFVLSDVHGCHAEMMQALTHWNPKTETLVVMGDLVDRGPDSARVVQTLMQLKSEHPENVVVLAGNHDQSFVRWAGNSDPEMFAYDYKSSHDDTLKSFYKLREKGGKRFKKASKRQRGEYMRFNHKPELRFLMSLQLFHETDHCVFVHAGVNLHTPDWRDDMKAMTNVRDAFYLSDKKAEKRVFFGHTPTALLRNDLPVGSMFEQNAPGLHENSQDNSVWFSPAGDKVALDGGVAFGGQLNAVRVNEFGDVTETVVVQAMPLAFA